MTGSPRVRVRCAIYTRKSTEEGLEQEFNTLHAQRESCEAYIRSQAGEGWTAIPDDYDDGGFSGGNMERPAIRRLLADVDAGKVDVIVVYKVDRLTRSLLDFARIVERLDARGVSFVSVTQAFNTTTSMGRLTLNVLLSFAQFEREVTGERIRDKIAASKAKGMWMGGNVPLGYDLAERRLLINPSEAEQVRHIFSRYLELGSGVELMRELRRDSVVSKRWSSRSGQERGGTPFSCGALYYLLQNRLYRGEIVHRGISHAGEHDEIISAELFDAVQVALAANRRTRRERPRRSDACLLAGLVRESDGTLLTTSFSYGRGGRQYRYYVSGSLDPSRSVSSPQATRVPARPLERLVHQAVGRLLQRSDPLEHLVPMIAAIELHRRSIHIVLGSDSVLDPHEPEEAAVLRLQPLLSPERLVADGNQLRLIVDRPAVFRGGRTQCSEQPELEEEDAQAGAFLKSAHRLLQLHNMSPLDLSVHVEAVAPASQRQRRMMALGLLAPRLQKVILQGGYFGSVDQLFGDSTPLAWADQVPQMGSA